ncbi:hypothetical protein ABZ498_18770 [Streptomyces lavendulocolor]
MTSSSPLGPGQLRGTSASTTNGPTGRVRRVRTAQRDQIAVVIVEEEELLQL